MSLGREKRIDNKMENVRRKMHANETAKLKTPKHVACRSHHACMDTVRWLYERECVIAQLPTRNLWQNSHTLDGELAISSGKMPPALARSLSSFLSLTAPRRGGCTRFDWHFRTATALLIAPPAPQTTKHWFTTHMAVRSPIKVHNYIILRQLFTQFNSLKILTNLPHCQELLVKAILAWWISFNFHRFSFHSSC